MIYGNVLKSAAYGPYAPYAGFGVQPVPGTPTTSLTPVTGNGQPGNGQPGNGNNGTAPLGIILAGGAAASVVTGAWSGVAALLLKEKFTTGFKIGALSTAMAIALPFVIAKIK